MNYTKLYFRVINYYIKLLVMVAISLCTVSGEYRSRSRSARVFYLGLHRPHLAMKIVEYVQESFRLVEPNIVLGIKPVSLR